MSLTNDQLTNDQLNSHYNYLDNILAVLTDIYNCPCINCIEDYIDKINLLTPNIKEFYNFLINNHNFIKQNEIYLKKIKKLIPNMITFNNVIIQDTVFRNIQISVSVIYLEDDENEENETNNNNTFTLDKLFQYYPEMRGEFMW